VLTTFSEHALVRPPYRASSPFRDDAVAYLAGAADATITMDCLGSSFRVYPDQRQFPAALALYRFREPFQLRVGVPQDFSDLVHEFPELANQPTQPRWEGPVTELLWLHGKGVPPEEEFRGSPLHALLESIWPMHLLLADEFL
jgi:hypothetical protein